MMRGKTKVAPNMATTCWAPRPMVLPQERRSSGATTPPAATADASLTFQPIPSDIGGPFVTGHDAHDVAHTPKGYRDRSAVA